jgi:hypothetical protein
MSSLTAFALAPGVLNTGTPTCVAETGTLLVPSTATGNGANSHINFLFLQLVRAKENREWKHLSSGNGVECFRETRQTLRRDLVVVWPEYLPGLGKVFDIAMFQPVVLYDGHNIL